MNSGDSLENVQLEPLANLLRQAISPSHGYIYLQGEYPWTVDSLGLIYLTDVYGTVLLEMEYPSFVSENNLQQVMQLGRAEDAISNAFFRKENVSIQELVNCFNYHYKHSGYLELT